MDFFDTVIEETQKIIAPFQKRGAFFDENSCWQELESGEVVLLRDTAFELGGENYFATGYNLITSKEIGQSEVCVVGKDLGELRADCSFARISLIQIDDIADEQAAYSVIRKIEYVKYHCFPKGYMMRSSSQNLREQVRVSREALQQGISFEKIGNLFIKKYLAQPQVKAVKVFFITDERVDYSSLKEIAFKNNEITKALNHVLNNVKFDCNTCNLKPICDEVEGMKELHFKKGM